VVRVLHCWCLVPEVVCSESCGECGHFCVVVLSCCIVGEYLLECDVFWWKFGKFQSYYIITHSWGSVVGTVSMLWAGRSGLETRQGQEIVSCPKRPNWL
jgi:hypothetical protein